MGEIQKNLSLFDMNKAYADFIAVVQNNEGEISDDHENQLVALEQALMKKADSLVWVLNKLESDANFYAEQAKLMKQFQAFFDKSHARLKNFCVESLKVHPSGGVVGDIYSIGLKKNPPAVSILDEKLIPKSYRTQIISEVIDKKTIAEDLKAGVPVDGCALTQGVSLKVGRAK